MMTEDERTAAKAKAWDLMLADEERLGFGGAIEYMNKFLVRAVDGRHAVRHGRISPNPPGKHN